MQRLIHMHERKKKMVSALTGKLTTYELIRTQDTCSRFTADMNQLKTALQNEFFSQGQDAYVENCTQIRETNYDYLLTDIWMPAESPIAPLIIVAIIVILKYVVPIVIAGIVFYAIQKSVHDTWFPPQKFFCDICGAEFPSVTALTAHRRTAHPEAKPYQCLYCGSAYNTAEELNAHINECPVKKATAGPDWLFYVLIIAVVSVGGLITYQVLKRI